MNVPRVGKETRVMFRRKVTDIMAPLRTSSLKAAPLWALHGDLAMKTAPPVFAKVRARVMVADDNKYIRKGVSRLIGLEKGLEFVGEAVNGQDAVTLARSLRPDIVIMDVNMPVMGGIEATVLIMAERPDTLVVGFSSSDRLDVRARMLKAGAVDLLDKCGPCSALITALQRLWAERGCPARYSADPVQCGVTTNVSHPFAVYP